MYWLADKATAFEVSQDPSWETEPEILIVWPYIVVTISSKVTATDVAAAQEEEVEVDVLVVVVDVDIPVPVVAEDEVVVTVPEIGVWLVGQEPVDAVL